MINPICKQYSEDDTSLSVFCHLMPKKKRGKLYIFVRQIDSTAAQKVEFIISLSR